VRAIVDKPGKPIENAVFELIKYVSKTNKFLDIPDAVATYLRAIRGVRVLQTFGVYYNFKLEAPITQQDIEALASEGIAVEPPQVQSAASFLRCECGCNRFRRIGVFSMEHVEMDENGRWLIKQWYERQRCRGSSTD
jgi:hypothetical protein